MRLTLPADTHAPGLASTWVDTRAYYSGIDPQAFAGPDPGDAGLGARLLADLREVAGRRDRFVRVADVDGDAVGFVTATLHEPQPHAERELMREMGQTWATLDALAVRRAHWRQGTGSALAAAAEEWARESGADQVRVTTYAHSPVSVPFYEALGYDHRAVVFLKYLE